MSDKNGKLLYIEDHLECHTRHTQLWLMFFCGAGRDLFFFLFATFSAREIQQRFTSPKFNSSPLKNDGWKTILSFWGPVTFQGKTRC